VGFEPILILDEASHLDAVSEQSVSGGLDLLAQSRVTLVIAHRFSTVRDTDLITVLEDGRVAETGSHRELLDKGGLYAHLVPRQRASASGVTG
jgi:ATP-binding cassette subfamily C protein CydCD